MRAAALTRRRLWFLLAVPVNRRRAAGAVTAVFSAFVSFRSAGAIRHCMGVGRRFEILNRLPSAAHERESFEPSNQSNLLPGDWERNAGCGKCSPASIDCSQRLNLEKGPYYVADSSSSCISCGGCRSRSGAAKQLCRLSFRESRRPRTSLRVGSLAPRAQQCGM